MSGHIRPLDGKESAGPDVKADILHVDSFRADSLKNRVREMETGGRGGHGTPEPRVESLVSLGVNRLRVPVEIRWNRDGAAYFKNPREGLAGLPSELDKPSPLITSQQGGFEPHGGDNRVILRVAKSQGIAFPALHVAYNAFPDTSAHRGEREVILTWIRRFQAEYLDPGAGFPLEMKSRGDNLGVIEHHQRAFREKSRQLFEYMLINDAATVAK